MKNNKVLVRLVLGSLLLLSTQQGYGMFKKAANSWHAFKSYMVTKATQFMKAFEKDSDKLINIAKKIATLSSVWGSAYAYANKQAKIECESIVEFDYDTENNQEKSVVAQPLYRNFAFLLGYSADNALSVSLESLIHGNCTPILVSKSVFLEFYLKYEQYQLVLKKWDILYNDGFFLLIPPAYKGGKNREESGLQTNDFVHVDGFEDCSQFDVYGSVDNKKLVDIVSRLFVPSYEKETFAWNIGFFGHGSPGYSMAGLVIQDFKNIVRTFDKTIKVNNVFYKTCHGAGNLTREKLRDLKVSFPIFAVGRDKGTSIKTTHLFDSKRLYESFAVDQTRCCWKESAARGFYGVFSYENLEQLTKRDRSHDDKHRYRSKKPVKSMVCKEHVISCKMPGEQFWRYPLVPGSYQVASVSKERDIVCRENILLLDKHTVDGVITLKYPDQKIISVCEGSCTHEIRELRVPSLSDMLLHFGTYNAESVTKTIKIDNVVDDQGNVVKNVEVTLPSNYTAGKITLGGKHYSEKTTQFSPFEPEEIIKNKIVKE